MELTVTLTKDEWEYILEVINLSATPQIKGVALNLLQSKLENSFKEQTDEKKLN